MSYGGFRPFALPRPQRPIPADVLALTSGRVSLRVLLEYLCPRRIVVPFYSCDALLAPSDALQLQRQYYAIDYDLGPIRPEALDPDDVLLLVDFFGLVGPALAELVESVPCRVIVDQAQACFAAPVRGCWHFNSLRKFFGLPDGSFLSGPTLPAIRPVPRWPVPYTHLLERRYGDSETAHREYVAAEANQPLEVLGMSSLATDLYGLLDLEHEQLQRTNNYIAYHGLLGTGNRLRLPARPPSGPLAYPYLPSVPIDRDRLRDLGLFIPRLWPECINRAQVEMFPEASEWSRALLPLPLDSRYNEADVSEIVGRLFERPV